MSKTESVKVAVRCRPISGKQVRENRQCIVMVNQQRAQINLHNPKADLREAPKTFTYDYAFAPDALQEQIYQSTAYPIVQSVVDGFNGTLFAYGQTGTGKTFTMQGDISSHQKRGIIPRTFEQIFCTVEQHPTAQFLIRVSFLELYNQQVYDLLSKNHQQKHQVRQNPDAGFYVKDLTSAVVKSIQQMHNWMRMGTQSKHVGQTLMNDRSSRSHSIFSITVQRSDMAADGVNHFRVGKLNLVDLAGSERQSKTGSSGQRFKQATNINKSLLTLGNVISSLVDGNISHIPYRDSKLTKLLCDSLGGNTKTVMIANIGPADYNFDETSSTLRYANRAKNIKNRPHINQDPKDALLREYQDEIAKLRAALELQGGGALPENLGGQQYILGANNVVQVQKHVYVEDQQKIQELESRLEYEKEEIQKRATDEIKKVEAQRNLAEGEKQRLIETLKVQEDQQRQAKEKQQKLLKKLKNMEKRVVTGNQYVQQAVRQEQLLIKANQEVQIRRQQQLQLERQLRAKQEQGLIIGEKYQSLQQEIDMKNKKLKKLWGKYQDATVQVKDIQHQFSRQREDMLDSIRILTQQLKMKSMIIQHFVPEEQGKKITKRAVWDDNADEWVLPHYKPSKDQLGSAKRPSSAVGLKQPTSEYARIARGLGDSNTRFRHENIISLDLDLPERTTQDYNGIISERIRTLISGVINDISDEQNFEPIESYANMQASERKPQQTQASKRPASARRPGSARKKNAR